ncbi:hypothetical protein SynNOUM97013_00220 [Synechococcus sp. NOUM97013]|nr:hypothetical protein SynNOUM97013_00220 [Synechococcus sp. NOUM97013]
MLTRFCVAEQPYWHAFVSHYQRLGAKRIHACVQDVSEARWLASQESCQSEIPFVVPHLVESGVPPDVALRGFDLSIIRDDAGFTLLVDCDEFVDCLRPVGSLRSVLDLYPDADQWYLPWVVRPLLAAHHLGLGGYWGHVGKPIVRSSAMATITNDHRFAVRSPSIPLGTQGLVVIHLWGRSFRDVLIKVFCNRFEDAKSADRDCALSLMSQGVLPIRLRIFAYLELQAGYLPIPEQIGDVVKGFDHSAEEFLLRDYLAPEQEAQAHALYLRYKNQLAQHLGGFPAYPAIPLIQLAELLPAAFGID